MDESLTLPYLIDYHLEHNPELTYAVFPSGKLELPAKVSYLEFGRACHRFALAVRPDAPVKQGEVVGLLALCDTLMYTAAVGGFIRAGLTPFPISTRNSAPAIVNMLMKVSSHRLVVTTSLLDKLVSEIQSEAATQGYSICIEELPLFTDIYPQLAHETSNDPFNPVPGLPLATSFASDTLLFLHSSGSTGFPKPIPFNRETLSKFCHIDLIKYIHNDPRPIVLGTGPLPPFHTMGTMLQLIIPLYTARPISLFAPQYPRPPMLATSDTAMDSFKSTGVNMTMVVPAFLEQWSKDPSAVKYLASLYDVSFGGGPLSAKVGDQLVAAGVKLWTAYGTTEGGLASAPGLVPEGWNYFRFGRHTKPRFIDQGDGSYELHFLQSSTHHVSILNLQDTEGYNTRDLVAPHPTKSDLWKIVGRADDVLILSNGEKVVPAPMEAVLVASPAVQAVVMFGRQRNQVGVLVEPSPQYAIDTSDDNALAAFRNAVWPYVEEANRDAPAFSHIYKEMILVASVDKPFARTPKGTVKRKVVLDEYQAEIDAIYETVENSGKDESVPPPLSWDTPNVLDWVSKLVNSGREGRELAVDADLFENGFDSLSATFLRNRITSGLNHSGKGAQSSDPRLPNNFIYAHPTIASLAHAVTDLIHPSSELGPDSHVSAMKEMIDKYTADFPAFNSSSHAVPQKQTILLTGSTGSLGSYLLAQSLASNDVAKVYAFNRPSSSSTSLQRNYNAFLDRGFDAGLLSTSKVEFVDGEIAKPKLGLSGDLYETIRKSVTVIIHNAWRLDFNLSLASFESHIHGVRNLVDLAMTSDNASYARLLFTSSVGVTQSWPRDKGPFPEDPIADPQYSIGAGYGESKYVGEQILARARQRGLQSTSFRIGQITGGRTNGAWALTDWVPALIKSSIALGCLPFTKGVASWIPFDTVASAILDIAHRPHDNLPDAALNLVHPKPIAWNTIFEAASVSLHTARITPTPLPLVDGADWYDRLRKAADGATEEDMTRIPAIKLLDFLSVLADNAIAEGSVSEGDEAFNFAAMETTKAQAASPAMRSAPQLTGEDVQRWVGYWQRKGLFA